MRILKADCELNSFTKPFERNALSRSYFLHCETIGTAKMGGQPSGWLLTKSKVLKVCYASRAKGASCNEHFFQTYSAFIFAISVL